MAPLVKSGVNILALNCLWLMPLLGRVNCLGACRLGCRKKLLTRSMPLLKCPPMAVVSTAPLDVYGLLTVMSIRLCLVSSVLTRVTMVLFAFVGPAATMDIAS